MPASTYCTSTFSPEKTIYSLANKMKKCATPIKCRIFLYQEKEVQFLLDKISFTTHKNKASHVATALFRELEMLLNCEEFKPGNLNCIQCRVISEIRQKTAQIAISRGKPGNQGYRPNQKLPALSMTAALKNSLVNNFDF